MARSKPAPPELLKADTQSATPSEPPNTPQARPNAESVGCAPCARHPARQSRPIFLPIAWQSESRAKPQSNPQPQPARTYSTASSPLRLHNLQIRPRDSKHLHIRKPEKF